MAATSRSIQSGATSSASSSGYTTTSHSNAKLVGKLDANGNSTHLQRFYQHQQEQQPHQYNGTSGKTTGNVAGRLRTVTSNGDIRNEDHLDHQQVAARRHLHLFGGSNSSSSNGRAMRAAAVAPPQLPMIPMMIDDELDVDDDAELMIDDDIEPTDSATDDTAANNNISAYPQHSLYNQHDCADSAIELVYQQQQQQQPQYLQLNQSFQQNGHHSGNSHLQHRQMLLDATTRSSKQQQQQPQQLDQRLSYTNKHAYPHQQQQLAVYHQPNLSQYLQYNQQRASINNSSAPFSSYQPAYTNADPNNNPNNRHLFTYQKPIAHQQRPIGDAKAINHHYQQQQQQHHLLVERSSCESSDERTSQTTGSKRHHLQQQLKAKKMMPSGSRQHLTPTGDSHHHHNQHHHQQQQQQYHSSSSKRKSANHRSKETSGAKSTKHSSSSSSETRLSCCGKMAKLLLFISNISFWSAGIALGAWGILSLVEDHKYNLSQLLVFEPNSRMSLFQLLAWSFITLGCATVLVGFCGCSAILKNNRWILGLYIFLILAIFALDLATGLLAIIFQEKLVANVRLRLVSKLRSEYGVQASFTAALDYIQTKYECCGLEGHFDYDQSLWRLQRLGGFEATVARTCCHLRNSLDDQAHINPRPVNESMCQSTDVRFHQSYRYRKGCLDDLERLIRQKIWTFTIGCGAVGAVILLSLLFATCFCRSIPGSGGSSRKNSSDQDSRQQQQQSNHLDHKKQAISHHGQVEMQHNRHYR